MEWISVKDRLPELQKECMVCSKDEAYALATYLENGWTPFNGPDFKVIKFKITHWMPLPNPPKDEK